MCTKISAPLNEAKAFHNGNERNLLVRCCLVLAAFFYETVSPPLFFLSFCFRLSARSKEIKSIMSEGSLSTEALLELSRETETRERRMGITQSLLSLVMARDGASTNFTRVVCALKELYSDFVVREISSFYLNGEPLRLELSHDEAAPTGKHKRQRETPETVNGASEPAETPSNAPVEAFLAAVESVLQQEDLEALKKGFAENSEVIALKFVQSKEQRTTIHQAVKTFISATHLSRADSGILTIAKATAKGRREEKQRSTPLKKRTFLHFTLYKENLDSSYVFRLMAKHLHISTRQLQFCGTKDKRGITLQRVAIRDFAEARLRSLNRCSFGPRGAVRVCGFQELEHGLRLGDAIGNHFSIILRLYSSTAVITPETIQCIETTLRSHGVINYFGPQRFGTTDILTSDIGVSLLQGNFKEAVFAIIASKATFVPPVRAAVEPLQQGRYADALELLPKYCLQERDVLRHLVKHPNDFVGAMKTLPRTLGMLYMHAVQSLVWNKMASARLAEGSRCQPEVGDLVSEEVYQARLRGDVVASSLAPLARLQGEAAEEAAMVGEGEEGDEPAKPKLLSVHRLTPDDPLDQFTLADVLLPVPGPDPDLQYPLVQGCTKQDYRAVLEPLHIAEEVLSSDSSDEKEDSMATRLAKVFHMHGTYRPLVVRPERMQLEMCQAAAWHAPVDATDLERLQRRDRHEEGTTAVAGQDGKASDPTTVIRVAFSLPSGSYATCVLREFALFSLGAHTGKESQAIDK